MRKQQITLLLILAATLALIPSALNLPAVRAPTTQHFDIYQNQAANTTTGCGGQTLCFNSSSPGPTITVNQGDIVQITVHNNDSDSHTFTLSGVYLGQSVTNAPGQTQNLEFTANTATAGVQYTCTFPGHATAGMTGTFRVNPSTATVSPTAVIGLLLTVCTAAYLIGRRRL